MKNIKKQEFNLRSLHALSKKLHYHNTRKEGEKEVLKWGSIVNRIRLDGGKASKGDNCVKYQEESEFDFFTRIGNLFNPDDPACAVDAKSVLGMDLGL